MFTSASKAFRFLPLYLVSAPLLLAHCSSGPDTWTDPNNASPAATLDVTLPVDASGHAAESPVGQPISVQIAMIQTGPGACHEDNSFLGCGSLGNSSDAACVVCAGPGTSLNFELTTAACEKDLCDVIGIQHDAATGDTVTLVPHAGMVTLRATGTSGSLVASGSIRLRASCTSTPDAPDCQ